MSLSMLSRDAARGLRLLSFLLAMPIHAQSVVSVEDTSPSLPETTAAVSDRDLEVSAVSLPDGPDCCPPEPSSLNPDYSVAPPLVFTAGDKGHFYLHRIMGIGTALGPAAEAGLLMASPPKAYPDNWRQGAAGFGRNYGAVLGRVQVGEFSRFAAGVALREDPRYYPSANRKPANRVMHAIGFTLADRSDSGHSMPAFGNYIGAIAGGFVGDAYLPANYADLRHAGVRTGIQLAGFAIHNITDEFAPEIGKISHVLKSRFNPGS